MSTDARPRGRDLDICSRLAVGQNARSISKAVGVSETTVGRTSKRWREWVIASREEAAEQAAARLAASVPLAASRLLELIQSPNHSVSLGACRTVLEMGLKWRESIQLEARLSQLENSEPQAPWLRSV